MKKQFVFEVTRTIEVSANITVEAASRKQAEAALENALHRDEWEAEPDWDEICNNHEIAITPEVIDPTDGEEFDYPNVDATCDEESD